MRTLQEKYNGIQEGKFSKDQFIVEARMQHPNIITRFNGYDDAIQILKNKGMIQEAKESIEEWTPYGNPAFSGDQEKGKEKAPLSTLQVGDVIYMQGVSGDNIVVKDKREDGTVGVGHPHNDRISYQDGSEEVQVVKRVGLKEARLTKNSLTDYRFKPTNDMDKYPYEQILRGLRVELETLGVHGTPTPEEYSKALSKVSKNLEKDAIFYTNQLAGVNPKVDLHDKMVDATAKNTVDTFNGMKKATLKEGLKNLIKQALQEEEEVYEIQGPKSDGEYKSELGDYLDDNQIYGYTDKIHDIMTGPSEEEAVKDLAEYLDDNQIYGYNKGIEQIYADYDYSQHWMNQPDEENEDIYESVSLTDLLN
jgi:hypothetical protein